MKKLWKNVDIGGILLNSYIEKGKGRDNKKVFDDLVDRWNDDKLASQLHSG